MAASEGWKINASSLIQKKVKNNKMKASGVKIIFRIQLQKKSFLHYWPAHFEKHFHTADDKKHIYL